MEQYPNGKGRITAFSDNRKKRNAGSTPVCSHKLCFNSLTVKHLRREGETGSIPVWGDTRVSSSRECWKVSNYLEGWKGDGVRLEE